MRKPPYDRALSCTSTRSDDKLTPIAAPAGFGKTTFVSEWATQYGRPIAWISLDEADSEAVRLVTYVVAALRTLAPGPGGDMPTQLDAPQPPIEAATAAVRRAEEFGQL